MYVTLQVTPVTITPLYETVIPIRGSSFNCAAVQVPGLDILTFVNEVELSVTEVPLELVPL